MMKSKISIIIFSILILVFNPLVQFNVYSEGFKDKNWFSFLEKSSKLVGSGNLYFFGIKLYRASLFSAPNFNPEYPFKTNFALQIKYSKKFSKEKIANISRKEIRKLNIHNKKDLELWHEWMLKKFPDILANDVLTGVFSPTFGIKLFHNNNLIASNDDIEFSKAFFSIWLNKETSEPTLRKKLLGISN